jgi:DNA mismatch endonuclease Vsr
VLGDIGYNWLVRLNAWLSLLRRTLRRPGYWSLAGYAKRRVKKALTFICDFEESVIRAVRERGLDGIVCGHIHSAAIKDVDDLMYANCGDWVDSCTAIIEHMDGRLELIEWRSAQSSTAVEVSAAASAIWRRGRDSPPHAINPLIFHGQNFVGVAGVPEVFGTPGCDTSDYTAFLVLYDEGPRSVAPMTDFVSPEKRSQLMRLVRSTGNRSTELRLIALFRALRITGWRRNQKLIGNPDFVFRTQRLCVFVDGCFWHGCAKCYRRPASNETYWDAKIKRNRARDRKVNQALPLLGWRVLRIWEHQLRDNERFSLKRRLRRYGLLS